MTLFNWHDLRMTNHFIFVDIYPHTTQHNSGYIKQYNDDDYNKEVIKELMNRQ